MSMEVRKESNGLKNSMVTREELAIINQFTKRALKEDEVYTFAVRLCDNEVDRDGERFPRATLEELAELFVGKSGIFDHEWTTKGQAARIYRTEIVEEEGVCSQGEGRCYLKGYAYMLRGGENDALIAQIEGGIKKEVSVGCSVERCVCSICGEDINTCAHKKGEVYGGKVCCAELVNAQDAYEWSFVAVPAQPRAGVLKRCGGEGAGIPTTSIRTQENLVKLHKRGRMLVASYEAIRFQRLDLFSVTLRQIGAYIARMHLKDAIDVLMNGDGNNNAATSYTIGDDGIGGTKGTLSYDALLGFWSQFDPYTMNTMLMGSDMMLAMLKLSEFQNPLTGLNFQGTGTLATPLGAKLLRTSAMPAGKIIGLDKNYALERICGSEVLVEYDKLIDRQLERAAITSISGFAKPYQEASKVLSLQ